MPLPTPVSTATRSVRSNRSCTRVTGIPLENPRRLVRPGAYRSPRMGHDRTAGTRVAHQRRERAGVPRRRSAAGSSRSCRRACCRSCPATSRWSPASTSRRSKTARRRTRAGSWARPCLFIAGFGTVFVLLGLTAVGHRPTAARPSGDCSRASRARSCSRWRCSSLGSMFLRAPWLYQEKRFHPDLGRYGVATPLWSRARRSASAGRRASARSSARSSASPRSQQRVWAGGTLLAVVLDRASACRSS